MNEAMLRCELPGMSCRRGKVREIYELGNGRLLLVATDRISAFDWVMPNGIPDKGRVLTGIAAWWFERCGVPHHVLTTDTRGLRESLDQSTIAHLEGRAMVVRRTEVIPFECVVRGYLAGSGWKEYRTNGSVCGESLPSGLHESSKIEPIFTPATKAESGHDENIPFSVMSQALGKSLADTLRERSLALYRRAADTALERGLILADTKFEWGIEPNSGEVLLIDEILTPDSSRYWPAHGYEAGQSQHSFDKQFVRDWLESTGWDKASPPPRLPNEVVRRTREKYVECYERLTGQKFAWT
jgi:phosphoribosylaminoimidazole-succinocarboxamide synthase